MSNVWDKEVPGRLEIAMKDANLKEPFRRMVLRAFLHLLGVRKMKDYTLVCIWFLGLFTKQIQEVGRILQIVEGENITVPRLQHEMEKIAFSLQFLSDVGASNVEIYLRGLLTQPFRELEEVTLEDSMSQKFSVQCRMLYGVTDALILNEPAVKILMKFAVESSDVLECFEFTPHQSLTEADLEEVTTGHYKRFGYRVDNELGFVRAVKKDFELVVTISGLEGDGIVRISVNSQHKILVGAVN